MYSNFDFNELERATREQMAKLYKESFDEQEYVDEECQNKTYNKIKKILECPEMEKCHPFLYSLDMENVNECDTRKIEDLYRLGVDRGMIEDDEEEEIENGENLPVTDDECDGGLCGGPSDSLTGQQMNPQPVERKPIYTVMYSAQKDGCGSMGEFYSMAPTIEGAKEDCKNQLMAGGFNDVMIMAVDQSFPAINTDVDDSFVDKSLDNVKPCYEDDSEEFLKQETGDTSDETKENEDTSPSTEDAENTEVETDVENSETSTEVDDSGDVENDDVEDEVEKTEDADADKEDSENEKKEDDVKNDTEEDTEGKEEKKLTAEEKTALKDEYTKIFKDVLKKMNLEKSVSDMTLQERTDFYTKLSEKWSKNDPSDFMNDKDQEKLNKVVVKKDQK